MATADTEERRRLAIASIPTAGFPAPAADGSQDNPLNSEVGRNVLNTLGAVAPVGGASASRAVSSLARVGMAGAASPAVSSVAPFVPPAAGYGALLAANAPAAQPPSAAPAVVTAPLTLGARPRIADTFATEPSTGAAPGGTGSFGAVRRTVGANGIPLFSDGNAASDGALLARGAPSAQNLAALETLGDRQQAESVARVRAGMVKEQEAREIAEAQSINERFNPPTQAQRQLRRLQLKEREEANRSATDAARAGADVRRAATDANRLALEAPALGFEGQTKGVQNQSAVQMLAAQTRLVNARTPEERTAAEDNLRALQGKYERTYPNKLIVVPGAKNADGSQEPGQVWSTETGQPVQGQGTPKLPPGMTRQVGTSGGKPVYEDANGKRFVGN